MFKRAIITLATLVLLFIAYQAIKRHLESKEVEQMISRSPLVYLCEKKHDQYIATRILKVRPENGVARQIGVGDLVKLNRQRLGNLDKGWEDLQIVVIVEPGPRTISAGQLLNQSEIPIIDGRLIPYPVSLEEVVK